jgi:polyisoprenoid-binding protein YceI
MSVTTTTKLPTGTFAVDPGHSTVEFRVTDSDLVSTIVGHFTDFEGTIELAEPLDDSRASGVIRTSSVDTHNEKRDEHLRSGDFFDAPAFPEIRFESTRIGQIGEDAFRIAGELSIKDFKHEIELETKLVGAGEDRFGNDRVSFESHGTFNWGPAEVHLTAHVSAIRES